MAKRKHRANIQFYIDFSAQLIYDKQRTIDDIFPKLREEVLEICKNVYGVDGYGNPLPEENTTEKENTHTEEKTDTEKAQA